MHPNVTGEAHRQAIPRRVRPALRAGLFVVAVLRPPGAIRPADLAPPAARGEHGAADGGPGSLPGAATRAHLAERGAGEGAGTRGEGRAALEVAGAAEGRWAAVTAAVTTEPPQFGGCWYTLYGLRYPTGINRNAVFN